MGKHVFFVIILLGLAGCATSSSYAPYTYQQFLPKDKFFAINVYSPSQPPVSKSYYVIGKVAVEGFASNGVTPESLTNQARDIARKKGADAIINANTEEVRYYGGDALLRFKGELIVSSATNPSSPK